MEPTLFECDTGIARLSDEFDLYPEDIGYDTPQDLVDNQYNGAPQVYEENK